MLLWKTVLASAPGPGPCGDPGSPPRPGSPPFYGVVLPACRPCGGFSPAHDAQPRAGPPEPPRCAGEPGTEPVRRRPSPSGPVHWHCAIDRAGGLGTPRSVTAQDPNRRQATAAGPLARTPVQGTSSLVSAIVAELVRSAGAVGAPPAGRVRLPCCPCAASPRYSLLPWFVAPAVWRRGWRRGHTSSTFQSATGGTGRRGPPSWPFHVP